MNNLRNIILDIFFPRHCLGCDIILEDASPFYICRRCFKNISFTSGFICAFCNSPTKNGQTCSFCLKNSYLDRLLIATSYENKLIEKTIKTIKYRFVKLLSRDVSALMIRYLEKKVSWLKNKKNIIVIPVPLHRKRLNWRGFNQAELIADQISLFFNWPTISNHLVRLANHKPQTEINDRKSRIENVRGIFHYQKPAYKKLTPTSLNNTRPTIKDKIILLIDDVSTTGSTLNDCARALKIAGAKEIIGFVFARGKLNKK